MKQMKSQELPITKDLIDRARTGDEAALTDLYRMTSPFVYRTIRSMVRDEDLAWDIQQNTYIRAFRGLAGLKSHEAFLPWLRRIAVNETSTELSRRVPLTFTELTGPEEDEPQFPETREEYQPELRLDRKETARLVQEILSKLPPEQQLVVGMHYFESMSIQEIAAQLGLAPGTVKAQLYRGRKRVEAEVLALEKQGVRLYGMSPVVFLAALLRNLEPVPAAEGQALKTVLANVPHNNTVLLTAAKAPKGFLHTLAGKLVLGAAVLAVAGGGVLTFSLLNNARSAKAGDPPHHAVHEHMNEDDTEKETEPPFEGELRFLDEVLIDEAGLKVYPKDLDSEGSNTVTYTIENNTGKELRLAFEDVAINGCTVSAGSEIYGSGPETGVMYLREDDLALYGINYVQQVSAVMVFTDEDGAEYYRSSPVVARTNAWRAEPTFDESGRLVYDDHGLQIYSVGMQGNDGTAAPVLRLLAVNRSGETVNIGELYGKTRVNRYTCMTSCAGFNTVAPGNCGMIRVGFRDEYLRRNHVAVINEVNMGFEIKNAGTGDMIDEAEVRSVWTNPSPAPEELYDADSVYPVLEQNGVMIVITGWQRTEGGDFRMEYYMDNHSGKDLLLGFVGFKVNGVSVSHLEAAYVDNGCRAFGEVIVYGDKLADKEIGAISEITLQADLEDQGTWTDYLRSEPVTIPVHEAE